MRFDVILYSDLSHDEMLHLGKLAEEVGIGGVWVANNYNTRDAFVNFVPLAQQTNKIRMGPIAISPFELHPQKMAHSLLTLNEMAHGRAQIVVGGGGGTAGNIGAKPHRVITAVRECVEILNQAITGEPGTYKGDMYKIGWLDVNWLTQTPPMIYVGANGPQMLKAAARYAEGIMVSDFTSERIRWAHDIIDPVLTEVGGDPVHYPLSNFWAWHVQESREAAQREARIFLAVRGTVYPEYIGDVVSEAEAEIVNQHTNSFMKAYMKKSPDIEGIPDEILAKIVDNGTSASPLSEIDREVERMREFEAAGLTEIALCIYSNPAEAIQTIGEHLVNGV